MPVEEIFAKPDSIFTPGVLEKHRRDEERRKYLPPQDLVASFDSLLQSQEYFLALGKAASMPKGYYVGNDLDRRRVSFEKNGATWTLGPRSVTREVTKQVSFTEFFGQMSFDAPVVTVVETSETISVDPKQATWERRSSHGYSSQVLLPDAYDYNTPEAEEMIRAVIESYNAPSVETEEEAPAEAVVFVSDEGRFTPESEFKSVRQRVEEAIEILKKRNGIYAIDVQRNGSGEIRLFIFTHDMYVKDDEKARMIEGVEGVDVIFDPLRDEVEEFADPKIKAELAQWAHVGRVNLSR